MDSEKLAREYWGNLVLEYNEKGALHFPYAIPQLIRLIDKIKDEQTEACAEAINNVHGTHNVLFKEEALDAIRKARLENNNG
jgi:hypothetical protein